MQLTSKIDTYIVTLQGIRPIMFDRYSGDNKTQLAVKDKGYLNERGEFGIPVLNVYSLLASQNTPSVAKRFYGKQGRDVALGVQAHVNIESMDEDPLFAILRDGEGKTFSHDDQRIMVMKHVARLKDGIPNPKERPAIPVPWSIRLKFEVQENVLCTAGTLERMVHQGGILGLGTFRPIFGRYSAVFEPVKAAK